MQRVKEQGKLSMRAMCREKEEDGQEEKEQDRTRQDKTSSLRGRTRLTAAVVVDILPLAEERLARCIERPALCFFRSCMFAWPDMFAFATM